jgi:cytochrome P450
MRQDAERKREVNMVHAFNLTTFDIVSDLSFGESFGGLKTRTAHPWIDAFFHFAMIRTVIVQITLLGIPFLTEVIGMVIVPFMTKELGSMTYTIEKIRKRMDEKSDRPDFMSYVLRHNNEHDEIGMTREEIPETFNILMIAGSETTATLLAGCTYLLHKHPRVLHKLQEEIRGSFESDGDITMVKVGQLKYLNAVIEESLRTYPPVPVALTRATPPEGASICGHWVPGNVRLCQSHSMIGTDIL